MVVWQSTAVPPFGGGGRRYSSSAIAQVDYSILECRPRAAAPTHPRSPHPPRAAERAAHMPEGPITDVGQGLD